MQKDVLTTCLAAPLLGAFGFFFRWLQLDNAFEDTTGLSITGSLWHKTMLLVCVLVTLFFLVRVLFMRIRHYSLCHDISLATRDTSLVFFVLIVVFSLIVAASGVLILKDAALQVYPSLHKLFGFFVILTAISAVALALSFLIPLPGKTDLRCLLATVPVVTACFWLFLTYHENAGNPTIWTYSIYILTVCGALLSFFLLAGYFFETPRPSLLIFTTSLTAFLGITSMADVHTFGIKLLMIGITGLLLVYTVKIVSSGDVKH